MGSLFEKPTIGFKYHMGMHLVVSQAPIDHVLAIKWQDEIAWEGIAGDGSIQIQKPELFGGAKKEGGVSGQIDVLSGAADQGVNDYLQVVQGDQIPAYRGVSSLVLRQLYIGNNPFLKPISVKVKNVHSTFEGWLPDLAPIAGELSLSKAAIYISLDNSGSMVGESAANQAASIKGFIESLKGQPNDIKLVAYSMSIVAQIECFDCSDSDYDSLIDWIDSLPAPNNGTDFDVAVSLASAFFTGSSSAAVTSGTRLTSWSDERGIIHAPGSVGSSLVDIEVRKILIFLTDGTPSYPASATAAVATLDAIDGVEVFAFNINHADTTYTEMLDNTPLDGVPVVSGGDPDGVKAAITNAVGSWVDINPAHILRDMIVSPTSGGDGNGKAIGTSFESAAATLYAEGFGLSFFHENPGKKEEFKNLIERHIDASIYGDRATGLWEIKLIRDDYTIGELFVFDSGNVVEFVESARPLQEDLPNQITVVYTKRPLGETASLTVTNVAAVQMLGQIIPEKIEYLGVTTETLATRLAARDLVALTVPLMAGAIRVTYAPLSLNIGSPFILNEPRLGIESLICRVTEIEEGDGRDNSVLIRYVEDRFSADIDADSFVPGVGDVVSDTAVKPPNESFVEEVPFWLAVQALGQGEVDSVLALDPDAGFYHATSDKPTAAHIDADIGEFTGGEWLAVATTDFAPAARLGVDLSLAADVVTFDLPYNDSLTLVETGDLCRIGGEFMRVDNMSLAGEVVTVTVGRGCLDTVPAGHAAGDWVIFWFGHTAGDEVQYTAGVGLDLAVFPKTSSEILPVAQASLVSLGFDSRAVRPYPPGKLQINGSYAAPIATGSFVITWAHRDRNIQTTSFVEDFTAGNIGPEGGVSYRVQISLVDEAGSVIGRIVNQDVGTDTTYTFDASSPFDYFQLIDYFSLSDVFLSTAKAFRVSVIASRGGYDCWQAPSITAPIFLPPYDLQLSSAHSIIFLAPANLTLQEII